MNINLLNSNNYISLPKVGNNFADKICNDNYLTEDSFLKSTTVTFCQKTENKPQIVPIKNEQEYINTIEKIRSSKVFDFTVNKDIYKSIPAEQEGLLLYAGYGDLSDDINRFLSGRPMKTINKSVAKDVVRAVDYSLKELDKEYGKYKGIVYRQGFFPINSGQYVSTTEDPVIAATLRGGIYFNKDLQYYIIKTNNGHRINEFQKDMGSDYADEEEEILIPRTSKLKEIEHPTGELLQEKKKFIRILEKYNHEPIYNDSIVKVLVEV